jgi:hypothetical protein
VISQFEKKIRIRHPDMDIVVAGNFNVSDREFAPVFTRLGWWYDYLGTDSILVQNLFMPISFEPGEYHVWTTRKINLDFNIATSVREVVIDEPLGIYPVLNDGQFEIILPPHQFLENNLEIRTLSGQPASFTIEQSGQHLEVHLTDAIPGVYFVIYRQDNKLSRGKVIVQ